LKVATSIISDAALSERLGTGGYRKTGYFSTGLEGKSGNLNQARWNMTMIGNKPRKPIGQPFDEADQNGTAENFSPRSHGDAEPAFLIRKPGNQEGNLLGLK
jgi:hypothetical protein